MTRDDIVEWTRQAGGFDATPEFLTRFASLVAAAEREKVARWQIGSGYTTGHGETIEDLLVELEWQVRESEREECARVCELQEDPPQRREWVGLTEEEIDACHEEIRVQLMNTYNTKDIYRVLEAKLKEKNA